MCLIILVVIAGYGLEQTRVLQREQAEVMALKENTVREDVSDRDQTIEEELLSEENPIQKSQTAKEENASEEITIEKAQTTKEETASEEITIEKPQIAEEESVSKEATAEKEQITEAKLDSERNPADKEADWTKVTVYEKPVTLYAQSFVNVRKGPDTSYDILGRLSTNDPVEVLGEYTEDNWMAVTYQGEKAFVSGRYLGDEQIDLAALQAEQEAAAMAALQAQQEAAATVAIENAAPEETAPPYIASPAGVVFVGDSRCVQMSAAVGGGGSTWICENSKRYSWFEANAVPRLDNIVGKGTKVVICMGVNDPGNYNQYAALTNQRAAQWAARGATTYFVSVNPVWENPYVTQEQVDTFNANMPGLLNGVRWIDTASIVKQGGYKLVDGLHYDTNAYINIFNLICGSL